MKDDRVYLKHILRCIARIEEYTIAGREGFLASRLIRDAVIRNLQIVAESGQRLSAGIKTFAAIRRLEGVGWATERSGARLFGR